MEALIKENAPLSLEELITHWKNHGLLVSKSYKDLCSNTTAFIDEDLVLAWFNSYKPADLSQYHLNHDMAKPFCAQWSAEKSQYSYGPNHSKKSAALFKLVFGSNSFIESLIENDMAFHTCKSDTIEKTWLLPNSEHLYATAWAELFANATIFGGTNSDSFKIKKKRLIWALKNKPLTKEKI